MLEFRTNQTTLEEKTKQEVLIQEFRHNNENVSYNTGEGERHPEEKLRVVRLQDLQAADEVREQLYCLQRGTSKQFM